MPEFRMRGDEVLEPERPEGSSVVGDQRDRNDFASLWIGQVIDERDAIEYRFGLCESERDPGDRVVLVRGR